MAAKESNAVLAEELLPCEPLAKYSDLLTVDDMAEVLDASTRTIYRMADKDELPHVKVGRRLYFPKNRLMGFLCLTPQP